MFIYFLVSNDAGEGALLLIRKENARKGSESNQNTHLRRVPLADNVLKKWEGEWKKSASSAEIGQQESRICDRAERPAKKF